MNNALPWCERINMLAVNPDAATREDVAELASTAMMWDLHWTRLTAHWRLNNRCSFCGLSFDHPTGHKENECPFAPDVMYIEDTYRKRGVEGSP